MPTNHRPVQTAITIQNGTLTAARGREQGSRRAGLLDELVQDRTDLNPRMKSFATYLTKQAELLDRAPRNRMLRHLKCRPIDPAFPSVRTCSGRRYE
jgi:hypothetical protein